MSYLVYITVPEESCALAIAENLVKRKLAAGVNVLPAARSVYRWRGEVCNASEHILFAQVSAAAFDSMKQAVLALHPHEVPCIVAMPIETGHSPFLDWIKANSMDAI